MGQNWTSCTPGWDFMPFHSCSQEQQFFRPTGLPRVFHNGSSLCSGQARATTCPNPSHPSLLNLHLQSKSQCPENKTPHKPSSLYPDHHNSCSSRLSAGPSKPPLQQTEERLLACRRGAHLNNLHNGTLWRLTLQPCLLLPGCQLLQPTGPSPALALPTTFQDTWIYSSTLPSKHLQLWKWLSLTNIQ